MEKILDHLSGGIPGGIYILSFILLAIQLTFMNLRKSGLLERRNGLKKQFIYSLVLIFIYSIIWFAVKPPLPRIRIVVLPSKENGTFNLDEHSVRLAELVERAAFNNQGKKYLVHRWEWLYETVGKDSVQNYTTWLGCAKRMESGVIIESTLQDDGSLRCIIHIESEKDMQPIKLSGKPFDLLRKINNEIDIFKKDVYNVKRIPAVYLQAKLMCLAGEYDDVEKLLANEKDSYSIELRASSLIRKAKELKVDREKAKYITVKNNDIILAKTLLYSLIKRREDTAETAYLLGRIAQWEEKFEDANTFFKKAYAEDLYNSRIYYAISFLLSTRLKELGFERRDQILEKALYFDPGYRKAVLELSQHYYRSSSGSPSSAGITKAKEIIARYLKIKPNDPAVLSNLASILVKTKKLDEAMAIYEGLIKRFPNESNTYYNMGTIHFYKKAYRKALDNYLKAIKIDKNLDCYLMAGFSYRQLAMNDSALYYYRERVKRKTGDDDKYALEAMKGIRIILSERNEAKIKKSEKNRENEK
jgi:tetratricopeptide (TPR) repeat protein